MKLGIIKEGKTPPDKRVALTPSQCRRFFESDPIDSIVVQPSPTRCYLDEQYEKCCVRLQEELNDCDVILGIKEMCTDDLIPGKTHLFFSHTTKMQPYNKELLKAVLDKKVRLLDYELMTNEEGVRIIGFGKWAGKIGTYNAFRAYALRNKLKEPKPAHLCENMDEVKKELKELVVKPIKIVVTGTGRVSKGSISILEYIGVKKISVEEFLSDKQWETPVYVQLDPGDYNIHKKGKVFDMQHFFANPQEYTSNFKRFCSKADMFIAAAFWDPKAPVLFTNDDLKDKSFRIKIIADITCDVNGSVPTTLRVSTIQDPFYGIDPQTGEERLAFDDPACISVMSVDNLPNEIAKDASKDFGEKMLNKVLPELINPESEIIKRATIAEDGEITDRYAYLRDWLSKK